MHQITLAEPWTYVTPLVTVDYAAGEHAMPDAIAAAALSDPQAQAALIEQEKDEAHGNRIAAIGAPFHPVTLEG